METLYPIKFIPIIKEKIWGGERLKNVLNKDVGDIKKAGESWEISAYPDNVSIVKDGFLEGNTLEEIIEVYMGDIVGDKVYDTFGNNFPLLIKFLDANKYLSVQVHPDDEIAMQRHGMSGKTEMWYIVEAEDNAELIMGLNRELDKQKYLEYFNSGKLLDILNVEKVNRGDVFYIPSGRIHAAGPGILLAEIQQTSDLTYRIYDWNRLDVNGEPRELHTEYAADAIDFTYYDRYKTNYSVKKDGTSGVVSCKYFTANIISLEKQLEKDYNFIDSFVIYMALEGETSIIYNYHKSPVTIKKGESVLIPASLKEIYLETKGGESKLLEIYIK